MDLGYIQQKGKKYKYNMTDTLVVFLKYTRICDKVEYNPLVLIWENHLESLITLKMENKYNPVQ